MAYVSLKMTESSPLPRWSSQMPVVPGRHQSSATRSRGEKLSCGGGTWERLTLLCLGEVGQSTLQCPACRQFRLGPGGRCYTPAVLPGGQYHHNLGGHISWCLIIFFGDLRVTAGIWESL